VKKPLLLCSDWKPAFKDRCIIVMEYLLPEGSSYEMDLRYRFAILFLFFLFSAVYKPHIAVQHEEETAAHRAHHPSALTGGVSAPLAGGALAPLSVVPPPLATDRAVDQSLVKITPHSLQRIYQHQVTF
jgi:hypothetical protein